MMKVALAFFVVFCATFFTPLGHCYSTVVPRNLNIIPISRRSLLNRRALAGDFDAVVARDEQQAVHQKYWSMAPEILAGILPAPENDMEDFVQAEYVNDSVTPDTSAVLEQVVGPVEVSDVLLTTAMTDVIDNGIDMLYYGDLCIGTPGQCLTFDVDTGSADLWVPSPWCSTCTKNHFDGSQSSTYVDKGKRFAVSYGSGSVYGTTALDTVTIAATSVEGQTIGIVHRKFEDSPEYPNDGIVGMAFGTIARSGGLNLFETMMKQGKVKYPCFSIHLARGQETGSEICWGCFDPTKAIGPINWFPVSHRVGNNAYWSVSMSGFDIAGQRTTFDEVIISAIDTGTTFCYFPESVAAEIYAKIPGSKDASATYGSGFYTYPCNSEVDIGFVFGNITFRLHPDDFNLGMSVYNSTECIGGVFAMDPTQWPENLAIIGDEFLKSWYSVYDYTDGGRVGFAPSANNQ